MKNECTPLSKDIFERATAAMRKEKICIQPQYIMIPHTLWELLSQYGDPETIIKDICHEKNIKIYIKCLNEWREHEN